MELKKLSKLISTIAEPKITYTLFFIYIAIIVHKSVVETLVLISFTIISAVYLSIEEKKVEHLDDTTFTNAKARLLRYSHFILLIVISLGFILFGLPSQRQDNYFFALLIILTLLLFFIAYIFHYKISAHITYNGYLLVYFVSVPLSIVLLTIFTVIVGFARINLNKHTYGQIITAYFLILLIMIISTLPNVRLI